MRIAREVADALGSAHRHDVIHRDIKPENILLEEGHAVVADFGIARAIDVAGGTKLTETGIALGTPEYMSPEQGAGSEELDGRSDLYSLGCVLYEMLGGQPPFTGATVESVVHQHLTVEAPSVINLRPAVPAEIAGTLACALAKAPADRFITPAEFAATLLLVGPARGSMPPHRRLGPSWLFRPGTAAASAALLVMVVLLLRGPPSTVRPGAMTRLTLARQLEVDPALSPDGEFVAYAAGPVGRMQLYVRQVGGEGVVSLTTRLDRDQRASGWSPDGRRIAFQSGGSIYVVDALGGRPRIVAEPPEGRAVINPAWSPDGERLAYVVGMAGAGARSLAPRSGEIVAVQQVDGGEVRELTRGFDLHSVAWSPDGSHIAYTSGASLFTLGVQLLGNVDPASIWVVPVNGGTAVRVTDDDFMNISPAWLPDGKSLLFVSNREGSRDIYQVRLDRDGRPIGKSVRITSGIGAQTISTSASGRKLAYSVFVHRANLWSLDVADAAPVSISLARPVTTGNQIIEMADVSPDGSTLVFNSDRDGNHELYKMTLAGGEPERLTDEPADDYAPMWSPDGAEIAFHTLRTGNRDIFIIAADGRSPQRVTTSEGQDYFPVWSADGARLAFLSDRSGELEVYSVTRSPDRNWSSPERLVAAPVHFNFVGAEWAPDGRDVLVLREIERQTLVVVLNAESREERTLLDFDALGLSPRAARWSEDGLVTYTLVQDADQLPSLWALPTTGGPPRLLVQFDDPAKRFVLPWFAVDGKTFYFTINEFESDIWVMDLTLN